MNKLKYIIYVGAAVIFTTACEKQLELEPAQSISGDLAVTTEDNILNVLIGTYSEAGEDESYGGQLQIMADLLGGGEIVDFVGTFAVFRDINNKVMLTDNGFVRGFWDNNYAAINQANLVIDNIAIVTSSDDEKNRIEGEAKFLRALCYFDLQRHFGSGDMGVPLRIAAISDYSVDLTVSRAASSAVYSQIISDLNSAISLLPEGNDFFADKYSAEALLARVYLQQGNFAAARDAANNVIQNSGRTLASTFAEAFNNGSNGSEDVFAFQVTSQDGANDLNNHYADEGNGGRGGDVIITDAYVALFPDADDQRANFFYPSAQSGDRLSSKYTNQFGNIPLIRLAEMHLIRAEANLEEGTAIGDSPINDLNALRVRAGAAEIKVDVTKEIVLLERKLELGYEGFFIHDVKRTNGMVQELPASSTKLTMPIPQSEIDTNPSITQNPGY